MSHRLHPGRYERLIAAGRCNRCSGQRGPHGTKTQCRKCADAAVVKRRLANGVSGDCQKCGQKPKFTRLHDLCHSCAKASRPERYGAMRISIRRMWRDSGLCIECGGARVGNTVRCHRHYLSLIGINATRGQVQIPWVDIDKIWQRQGGRCHYTGIPIALGVDAELDHMDPYSRFQGRAADIDNYAFCHSRVNTSKSDQTAAEFVEMCHLVASLHPRPTGIELRAGAVEGKARWRRVPGLSASQA